MIFLYFLLSCLFAMSVVIVRCCRGDHFRFSSVFIKKSNQNRFFLKKKKPKPNGNRFKLTGFGSVRLFWGKNWFKPVWLGLSPVGSVWLGCFWFFSVWVRFGLVQFFRFQAYKTKLNRTGQFFQNSNRFYFTVRFFRLFLFLIFSV